MRKLGETRHDSVQCQLCLRWYAQSDIADLNCYECREKYPDSLLKAHADDFEYAMGLITGEIILFQSCSIQGNWVHLHFDKKNVIWTNHMLTLQEGGTKQLPLSFDRGLDVHIKDIVWCCDAPFGS